MKSLMLTLSLLILSCSEHSEFSTPPLVPLEGLVHVQRPEVPVALRTILARGELDALEIASAIIGYCPIPEVGYGLSERIEDGQVLLSVEDGPRPSATFGWSPSRQRPTVAIALPSGVPLDDDDILGLWLSLAYATQRERASRGGSTF